MARGMPLAHHEGSCGRSACDVAGLHYAGDDELADYEAPAQQQLQRDPKDEQPAAWLVFNGSREEKCAVSQSQLQRILRQCLRSDADARSSGQSVTEVTAVTARTDALSLTRGRKRSLAQSTDDSATTTPGPAAPNSTQTLRNDARVQSSLTKIAARKRRHSLASILPPSQSNSRSTTTQATSHDESDPDDQNLACPTNTSIRYTFRVGDLKAVKHYMEKRLDELTLKPAREILTSWIKVVEPKRSALYGRYTKKAPKDDPMCEGNGGIKQYPPWWPEDIPYWQPSHLERVDAVALFIHILLLHRMPMADGTQRTNWVKKLRDRAIRTVENINDEQFASGKSPEYNALMKKRALNEILDDLFDVAQAYEDHYTQYGSDEDAIDFSVEHTWHPASARPRQLARMQVAARNAATPVPSKRICLPVHKNEHPSDTEEDTDIEQTLSARPTTNTTRDVALAPAAPNYAPLSPEIPDTKPQLQVSPAMTAMPSPMKFQAQLAPSLSHISLPQDSPLGPFAHFAQNPMTNHWPMPHSHVPQTAVPALYPSPIFNETMGPLCPAETMAFTLNQAQPFSFKTEDTASMFTTSFGSNMSFDDEEQDGAAAAFHGLPSYLHL